MVHVRRLPGLLFVSAEHIIKVINKIPFYCTANARFKQYFFVFLADCSNEVVTHLGIECP